MRQWQILGQIWLQQGTNGSHDMTGTQRKRWEGKNRVSVCLCVAETIILCMNMWTLIHVYVMLKFLLARVCVWAPLAHMLVPVKSRKLQATFLSLNKKKAPTSQSVAAYETAVWPDIASPQSLCCRHFCLQHHCLACRPVWKYPSALMDISFNNQWLIPTGNDVYTGWFRNEESSQSIIGKGRGLWKRWAAVLPIAARLLNSLVVNTTSLYFPVAISTTESCCWVRVTSTPQS